MKKVNSARTQFKSFLYKWFHPTLIEGAGRSSRGGLGGCSPWTSYWQHLIYKLEEGPFLGMVRGTELLEFAHGPYQNMEHQRRRGLPTSVIFVGCERHPKALEQAKKMLGDDYSLWELTSSLPEDLQTLASPLLRSFAGSLRGNRCLAKGECSSLVRCCSEECTDDTAPSRNP